MGSGMWLHQCRLAHDLEEACHCLRQNDYEDMKKASIVAVSKKAADLGISVGDTGESALIKMQ
jgi:uncharacterized protein YunC (DUF1805 family)